MQQWYKEKNQIVFNNSDKTAIQQKNIAFF